MKETYLSEKRNKNDFKKLNNIFVNRRLLSDSEEYSRLVELRFMWIAFSGFEIWYPLKISR